MKLSKYNKIVDINDEKKIMYNILSRKYIDFNESLEILIDKIIGNSKSIECSESDINTLKVLYSKGFIITDETDELDKVKFIERKVNFQDQTFYLKIQPTLDCNFRCVYCYQEHRNIRLDDDTTEKIIKFTDICSKKVKRLNISWFGGEPMLEFDRIECMSKEIMHICERNGCRYSANITSNGYFFTEEICNKLIQLKIESVQITIDGKEEAHNKKRPLKNGKGTFNVIIDNLITLLKKNIKVVLRINVDEENYEDIEELLDMIPEELRKNSAISIANLFQCKDKLDLYSIYEQAIIRGYRYDGNVNTFLSCNLCSKNGLTIEASGRVVPCSVAGEKDLSYGYLNDNGQFILQNEYFYYKMKNISAFDNKKCVQCIKLPMCMGGCKFSRYLDEKVCNKDVPDGMSIEEKIKLHYLYDEINNKIERRVIV